MSEKIACVCGKQYAWKPQLAGKRGKCQCGRVVAFPAEAPVAAAVQSYEDPAVDPLAALGGLEPAAAASENPAPAYPYATPQPASPSASSGAPSILVCLGVLAGGLAAMALFVFWPMVQVLQGQAEISITFKGIAISSMLTAVGLNLVLFGDKGIPWKKTADQPLTGFQKAVLAGTVVVALGMVGLVWLFFSQHGYEIHL